MTARDSLIATQRSRRSTARTEPVQVDSDRPIRVLMIVEASGGGAGRHVLDLCEGLLTRGCDVHLIYSPGRMDRFFRERLGGLDTLTQVSRPMRRGIHPGDLPALASIRRYIRECGPFDVIHGHSAKGGALARLSALGTSAPAFYTPHGLILMDPGVSARKRLFYQAIEWALSKVPGRVIAVSPEEQRLAVRKGMGRSRVVLIPNGITPLELPARAVVRRELGLTDDLVAIGFIGRLVDQKAPDVLLKSFAMIAPGQPQARLVIVGSGPLESPMRTLAEHLGVDDRILWLGERDGTDVLSGLDLFAISSRKEGLPYVLIEALAAGLPVVATATAGVELLVEHDRNGLIVPPNAPEAFATALAELTCNPIRRALFALESRRRSARFSTDAMVDQTLATYRTCFSIDQQPANAPGRALMPPVSARVPRAPARKTSGRTDPSVRGESIMASKPQSAEMHPGPGFRVRVGIERPDPGLVNAFRKYATPDISDLLNRLYAMDPAIRGLTDENHVLCGPACTVKVFPGDNLMVHKALDVAQPGDVIVVDAAASTQNAVLGDLISTKARHRGVAGFVVDGLIRDLPAILPLDFPVFARGTTPIGPLHRGPGEINYPICCGGVVVNPGDLIVGDAAGIIVIPAEIAPELLERLEQHDESQRAYVESVRRGEFSNRWVDRLLEDHGCPIIERTHHDAQGNATNGDGARNGAPTPDGFITTLVDGTFEAVSS